VAKPQSYASSASRHIALPASKAGRQAGTESNLLMISGLY
jgi:NADH:ubiquinone oxidoreductase subunit K